MNEDDTTRHTKITEVANAIANRVGDMLADVTPALMEEQKLPPNEMSVVYVLAAMRLFAFSVVALLDGMDATQRKAAAAAMMGDLQSAVDKTLKGAA